MSSAPREDNRVPSLVAKSDADNTPVIVEADAATKRLKVNATITGGVTSTADTIPASQSITLQDTGSTTATTNANSQSFRTGTPTVGSVATFNLSSWKTVIVEVTGTWTGTLLIEGSRDGVTYYQKAIKQIGTAYLSNSLTANFAGTVNVAALSQLAVRSTTAWTGTATVAITESLSENGVYIHNGISIQDSAIATNKLTIKSASTAPLATDPSVVVTESPNSPAATSANQTNGSQKAVVTGAAADGAAVTGNPVLIAGQDGTNAQSVLTDTSGNLGTYPKTTTGALGDALSNTATFPTNSAGTAATNLVLNYVFGPTNWERGRAVTNATNSTGTGITAVGNLAQFDDVSPTAITENQFGNLRMSANRNAYTTIRDAAGNERGANVTASNELVVSDSGLRPASTSLNTFSVHLTTNTTTTPIASTAYISSVVISNEVGGTTSTVTIQDKQGTPLKLINGLATTALTTAPTVVNFQTPVKMVSGIDIITAGAVAATVDVWVNYYA